ncbi:MAG: hypothetical protein P1S60_10470, partial [Anaerolineae bacterium]|nr:hypothetical protein [Anaerolineae bacterium]
ANEISTIIQWALNVQAHSSAGDLAALGHALYPDDKLISRLYRALAAPFPPAKLTPANQSPRLNRQWLNENGSAYRGQYVILKDGELISSANSIEDLKSQFSSFKGYFVTKVW